MGSQPCDVPLRPSQARHESGLDRVQTKLCRDDRDRPGRTLGSKGRWLTGRHNDFNWQTRELGRKVGEPFYVAARIPVLDSEVLPLDVTKIA